jgi:hypothetical protein
VATYRPRSRKNCASALVKQHAVQRPPVINLERATNVYGVSRRKPRLYGTTRAIRKAGPRELRAQGPVPAGHTARCKPSPQS